MPVKLQKATEAIVSTPEALAAIKDELHFDKNGKIIQDENYKKAYVRYANLEERSEKGRLSYLCSGLCRCHG